MKKAFIMMGVVASLSLSALGVAGAQGFSDTNGHWAQNTIEWGQAQRYVSGYEDGSFKPDKQVTEAEFTTMLIATFHLQLDPVTPQRHWADDFYGYAEKMNYPLSGFDNLDARNQPISRSKVAEMVAAVQGQNLLGEEAIKYLLVNGLSHGKSASTVDGYAGNDNLTRAEAISFIKNVLDKGLSKPQSRPMTPTDTTKLDQQYQDMVKKQQPSQPVQQSNQTTWTPGDVHVIADQLFPSYKDNGDSVAITMPNFDGYDNVHGFIATYYTSKYKGYDPRYEYLELKEGQSYTFQKGNGGEIGISIQGSTGSNIEGYTILIDSGAVYYEAGKNVSLDSILKALGVK